VLKVCPQTEEKGDVKNHILCYNMDSRECLLPCIRKKLPVAGSVGVGEWSYWQEER